MSFPVSFFSNNFALPSIDVALTSASFIIALFTLTSLSFYDVFNATYIITCENMKNNTTHKKYLKNVFILAILILHSYLITFF